MAKEGRSRALPASLRFRLIVQVAILAIVYKILDTNGTLELVANHFYMHNPLQKSCGLLENVKEFVILSDNIVRPDATLPGYIHVQGQNIAAVVVSTPSPSTDRHTIAKSFLAAHPKLPVLDYGSSIVGPGLIDVHVHMNEPGREHWEGIDTATSAAAAGGITTVIDMPLNSDPCTTTPKELARKLALATQKARVDVGVWAGLVPGNAHDPQTLKQLIAGGALGFKAFMAPSGINDFPHVSKEDLKAALPTLKALGVPLLLHAELVDNDVPKIDALDKQSYSTWLTSRPPRFEEYAYKMAIDVLKEDLQTPAAPGFGFHIVHVSDAALPAALHVARQSGLPVTWETCPHYLVFAAEDVKPGDTRFKCAPPIREASNQAGLWKELMLGDIDGLSSDHSPAPPELKKMEEGDFIGAWGGIAGLQYALPASWNGMQERGMKPEQLHKLWSIFPAKLAGLSDSKGILTKGAAADIVVWNSNEDADTSSDGLYHKHKVTPYQDMKLKGRVVATFVGGNQVFAEKAGVAKEQCGHVTLRKKSRYSSLLLTIPWLGAWLI